MIRAYEAAEMTGTIEAIPDGIFPDGILAGVMLDKSPECPEAANPATFLRYRNATVSLEAAQEARGEAVCEFLAAQAAWQAQQDMSLPGSLTASAGDRDPLAQAEESVRRAKSAYCRSLEQLSLIKWLVQENRAAFLQAERHLGHLAIQLSRP